jgi:aspartate/glutamate racemase
MSPPGRPKGEYRSAQHEGRPVSGPVHPRIALIHAVAVAMPPVVDALAALWPEARVQHLLDDALPADREADGRLTDAMNQRIAALARYAHRAGADGILFTCSAFGPAIDAAKAEVPVPVFKPNEAMFAEALTRGNRVGMLATFAPSVASMEQEFHQLAAALGVGATIETICVPEAMRALQAGDAEEHDRLLASKAPALAGCDVLLLAHFSTSRAFGAVAGTVPLPVITSPRSAVCALRRAIELGDPTRSSMDPAR